MEYIPIILLVILLIIVLIGLIAMNVNTYNANDETILWTDKCRPFLGLPVSTTSYALKEDLLLIKTGFLSKTEDEVRLYRILDVKLEQSFGQRIFNLGTISLNSSDKSQGNFKIVNIKDPAVVKALLSESVEKQRDEKRVVSREFMIESDDFEEDR